MKHVFEGSRVLTAVEVFQKASPSVFVVEVRNEDDKPLMLGSAVALTRDLLITNCHVVRNGSSLRVRRGEKNWTAQLITAIPEHDLCGLRPNGLALQSVVIRLSSKLSTGEHVYAVGSPEGLELTFSEGVISGLRENEGSRMIQTSAPVSPGSSGGGLFDAQGNLVGITTLSLEQGQNLNFALPGEWVTAVLKSIADTPGRDGHRASDAELESKAWFQIGLEAVRKEEYEVAIHSFRKCADLKQSQAARAWFELGAIEANGTFLGSASDAYKAWFSHAFGNWPPQDVAEALGKRAVEAYEKAIELKPDCAEAWRELGRMYFRNDEYRAIEAEKEATRLDSNDKKAWLLLGALYWKRKSYDEAINAFRQGLQAAPNDTTLLSYLGMIYDEKNDRQGMLDVYDQLKRIDPKMAQDYFRIYVAPHSAEGSR